ncbi:YHYH protein [Glaciecola sp. 2405UD65-10]|uniref:YHYH protein n=1 Tax=Glaciecola sp. 2405UD65-10 TaxID=3397244 RepID=UPI003B5CFB13
MKATLTIFSTLLAISLLGACSSDSDSSSSEQSTTSDTGTTTTSDVLVRELDPNLFDANALSDSVATTTCTLSNGETSQCYEITVAGVPSNYTIGSFCPRDIYATADEVGIWFDGSGEVYDIDGDFIQSLATLYNDSNWQLYDPITGQVNVSDTLEACDGAARPNVAAEYQNHCVECSIDYVNGGVSETFLIPITPVLASSANSVGNGNVGVSLNGVTIAAPAPVDAILGAYTIAAFDDCAGHINPVAGYHYHGSAGCSELLIEEDGHASMFAYALDGFGIYGMLDAQGNEASDLDNCRGHEDDTRGYHYHAASVAENMFIGCFSGETAQ